MTKKITYKKIILIASITFFLLVLINFIIFPAFLSTTIACRPDIFQEQYSDDYFVAGETSLNTDTGEVTIELAVTDKSTLKHELIHAWQFKNRDLVTCNYLGSQVFLREVEAYLGQYYPDVIFNKLYLNGITINELIK